jgi:hypothetical protein
MGCSSSKSANAAGAVVSTSRAPTSEILPTKFNEQIKEEPKVDFSTAIQTNPADELPSIKENAVTSDDNLKESLKIEDVVPTLPDSRPTMPVDSAVNSLAVQKDSLQNLKDLEGDIHSEEIKSEVVKESVSSSIESTTAGSVTIVSEPELNKIQQSALVATVETEITHSQALDGVNTVDQAHAVADQIDQVPVVNEIIENQKLPLTTDPYSEIASQANDVAVVLVEPPLKKGMILKQGHVVKNWKSRFFVLEKGVLTYFESQTANPPYGNNKKGEVILKGLTIEVKKTFVYLNSMQENKNSVALLLDIKYPNERDEWVEAIQSHIDYINKL